MSKGKEKRWVASYFSTTISMIENVGLVNLSFMVQIDLEFV